MVIFKSDVTHLGGFEPPASCLGGRHSIQTELQVHMRATVRTFIKLFLLCIGMKIKEQPEDFVVKEITTVIPGEDGSFAYFLLKKRNKNTLDVVHQLARALKIPAKNIGYAGIKDKVAVTEQVCSIKGVKKELIESIIVDGVELTYLGRGETPVRIGELEGNHFTIIVRDIKEKPAPKKQFVNYFGEQRFGGQNADIGKAIVKGDFKQATELIATEDTPVGEKVRDALEKNPNNHIGALKTVAFTTLRLYIHAYQSLIWNKAAKQVAAEGMNKKIPLPGFGSEEDPHINTILSEEGITLRDFIIQQFPDLSAEGAERDLLIDVNDLEISDLENNAVTVEFTLPKGSYATEFIKQLFS